MRQKGFAPILVIILILAGITGFYYLSVKRGNFTPSSTPIPPTPATNAPNQKIHIVKSIPAITSNWKTYKTYCDLSSQHYQIKYPEDWTVTSGRGDVGFVLDVLDSTQKYGISFTFSADGIPSSSNSSYQIYIFPDDSRYRKTKSGIVADDVPLGEYTEIRAEKVVFRRKTIFDTKLSTIPTVFVANKNGDFCTDPHINYQFPNNYDNSTIELMDQILSTFNFTQ